MVIDNEKFPLIKLQEENFKSPVALNHVHQTWQGVTYREGLPSLNLHNPLKMSCDVTWQIKNIISPLSQALYSSNLSG